MGYTILGLFNKMNETADVMPGLEKMSVKTENLKLLTSAPYPEGAVFEDHTPTPLWVFPLIFGFGGTMLGLALSGGTQLLANLWVGGKAPIALPAIGVICYELTLGGAVIGTILGMLWMQGLPDWRDNAYDPLITSGKIGLLVNCDDEAQASKVEDVMKSCGAIKIKQGRDDF